MLKKQDLFIKDQLWFSPKEKIIYNFLDESSGYYRDEENEQEGVFQWAFNAEKNIIKIVFPYENEEDIVYFYKFVIKENNNYLFKKYDSDKKLIDEILFVREEIELPVSYKNFKDMDNVDQIVFFIVCLFSFCIFVLAFAFTPIISGFSGFYVFLFGLITIGLAYKKIMSLSFLISKNHKKTLEKILFKQDQE